MIVKVVLHKWICKKCFRLRRMTPMEPVRDQSPRPDGVEITHDERGSTLRITSPRTVRALAHETRQHVLELLYDGEVLTATQAAREVGITPSAMSYHLRALEKHGIVRRTESGDGRERPWRAVADHLSVAPSAALRHPGDTDPDYLTSLLPGIERTLQGGRGRSGRLKRGTLRLTAEQAAALDAEIDELVARWEHRSHDQAEGAVTHTHFWINMPTGQEDAH